MLPDPNRNCKNITFDTVAGNYALGSTTGNALLLTAGGEIQIASSMSGTANVETIDAPLSILGPSASYFIENNRSSAGVSLVIGGPVSIGSPGPATLTFSGNSLTSNTISGVISNGSASVLTPVCSSGTWVLTASNTFTGPLTINGGAVALGGSAGSFTSGTTLVYAAGTLT